MLEEQCLKLDRGQLDTNQVVWIHCSNSYIEEVKVQEASMEKLIKPSDKESMRLAMLKHEETFRDQVYELHRLYRVQKFMMRNIQKSKHIQQNQERRKFISGTSFTQTSHQSNLKYEPLRRFDLEQPTQEFIAECGGTGTRVVEYIDETDIELTLGPSSYVIKKKMETPLISDSGPSFSSCSTGSIHSSKKYLQTRHWIGRNQGDFSLAQVPDFSLGSQGERKSNIDIGEQLRQPSWVFPSPESEYNLRKVKIQLNI